MDPRPRREGGIGNNVSEQVGNVFDQVGSVPRELLEPRESLSFVSFAESQPAASGNTN